ncbi:four-carbon acid sugar kinase family protein [Salinactinospora qingdaonensis]|uniref:Four-carbon acid sugar kinase family protein n=1 Tax=Salinactinospora qingdaonensis TaxID=702744 RepID=A0ABP7EYZ4_9ACTN
MAHVLVVADDLTGANATGARFARSGLRVATVAPEHVTRGTEDYDVIIANLDSRHLPPQQAADLVTDVVEAVWPVSLVVKRTDTTLRGNVGAELEAAWRAVRERVPASTRVRALFTPAFPASGRVTVDGVQLLDGAPLERTELAYDPLTPMTTSVVAEIVARQSELPLRHVPMRKVTQTMLTADLLAGDEPIVLCDAFTEQHIADIAAAAAEAHRRHGTVWVSVDPGPAGAMLADALRLGGQSAPAGPLLAVIGSATELTRRQVQAVRRTGPMRFVDLDVAALVADDAYRREVAATLTDHLATAVFPELVVVRTVTSLGDINALSPAARRALPHTLASLVADVVGVEAPVPSGLFTSGGDVTSAVLDELGVRAFEVGGEVLPLAVYGVLSGGPLDGVPVVTKGGLIGDDTALVECFARLRRAAQTRLRQVRSEVSEHVVLTGGEPLAR